MASKSALAILQSRILSKRPHEDDGNKSPTPRGSRDLKFSAAPESPAAETQPSKRQKGKKIAKEVIRVDAHDSPTLESRPEDNVLDKNFPYLEFMDNTLVTPAVLDQIRNDDDIIVDRF